jgi:hypothetical protein
MSFPSSATARPGGLRTGPAWEVTAPRSKFIAAARALVTDPNSSAPAAQRQPAEPDHLSGDQSRDRRARLGGVLVRDPEQLHGELRGDVERWRGDGRDVPADGHHRLVHRGRALPPGAVAAGWRQAALRSDLSGGRLRDGHHVALQLIDLRRILGGIWDLSLHRRHCQCWECDGQPPSPCSRRPWCAARWRSCSGRPSPR